MERLGDVDRLLTNRRIEHEYRIARRENFLQLLEFLHQLGIHLQPAGGVEDGDIPVALLHLA